MKSLALHRRFQIDHANDHGAARIKGKVLETVLRVESPQWRMKRMEDDAPTRNIAGGAQRSPERKLQQGTRDPPALMPAIDSQLAKQRCRERVRLVAPPRFGKARTPDLRRAQSHIADNGAGYAVANNIHARDSGGVVRPCVTPEPKIHRLPFAIE